MRVYRFYIDVVAHTEQQAKDSLTCFEDHVVQEDGNPLEEALSVEQRVDLSQSSFLAHVTKVPNSCLTWNPGDSERAAKIRAGDEDTALEAGGQE
jgi:hypothetical protein|tara:strand:+ start:690 stop:974 length:285 start_codon:yes stop_codon:yes gene_type:complete